MIRPAIIVTLAFLCAASEAAANATLWGITADEANIADIVTIDLDTGATTTIFSVTIPEDHGTGTMAWHAPSSTLWVMLNRSDGVGGRLLIISPENQIADHAPIVGLPAGQMKLGGIEFDASTGRMIFAFGVTGGFEEDRIAHLGPDGGILALSSDIGLGDSDVIGYDATTGQVVACDFNANDGLPRLAEVTDIFGSPSWNGIGNPPSNGNVGDVAYHPESGRLYVIGFDGEGGDLIEVADRAYEEIGPFNASGQVHGIAFVPMSACPADLDGCGVVDIHDLLILLSTWGPCPGCAADFDGDDIVGVSDLLFLLSEWGPC